MNFFDKISARRDAEVAEVDNRLGVAIRNHLVQLFRKAWAVDRGVEGLVCGMGGISIKGNFLSFCDDEPNAEPTYRECNDYNYRGGFTVVHPEVEAWLEACREYDSGALAQTTPVAEITLNDLVPLPPARPTRPARYGAETKLWRSC